MSRLYRAALVLIAIAFAAPAAYGASPTPQTVRLSQLGIVFRPPATWTGNRVGLRYDAHAPDGVASLTIQEATTKLSLSVIGANFAKAELQQLKKTDPHASVVTQRVALPVGAAVRVTIKYEGLWSGRRAAITHVTYTFKRGSSHAYIFDFGTSDTYTAKVKAIVDASIKSLHFLGAATA